MNTRPLAITYLFTTFPKATEMFLQREIAALRARGVRLRIHSMWGGGGAFRGIEIETFNKWRLLELLWLIPYESWRRPDVLLQLLRGLATRRAPSWINFWENMLGAGFACLYARSYRRSPPGLIHAAWSGAPATAAWLLWRLDGHRFTAGAHAYDIFENGGDWWLREKLEAAVFVHTSTEIAREALIARGVRADKVICIRSGLERLPALKPLRSSRVPLHLLSIARLVEKKGLDRQLRIYAALNSAGVDFSARIVGDGPLKPKLEKLAGHLGVAERVTFVGHVPPHEVWEHLDWSDVLIHTGVVAPSGDRDGLPNAIAEAMAAGVPVVTSPVAGTTEAVSDGATGVVLPVDRPDAWVGVLRRLSSDDAFCDALRLPARSWVEANFDVRTNTERLLRRLEEAAAA
ncbi:MAG TPA: glycosyltransferase [Opitutaceae bacterium]|nr:glycosyltransferase [Opitutaceae bacterium]